MKLVYDASLDELEFNQAIASRTSRIMEYRNQDNGWKTFIGHWGFLLFSILFTMLVILGSQFPRLFAKLATEIRASIPSVETDDSKFETKIKATVNPDELQAWATNLIAEVSTRKGESFVVKQPDIPKWAGKIYEGQGEGVEGDVSVERSDEGTYVRMIYGGGFGHWGLAVGDPKLVLTDTSSWHGRLWKPGIYFWSSP